MADIEHRPTTWPITWLGDFRHRGTPNHPSGPHFDSVTMVAWASPIFWRPTFVKKNVELPHFHSTRTIVSHSWIGLFGKVYRKPVVFTRFYHQTSGVPTVSYQFFPTLQFCDASFRRVSPPGCAPLVPPAVSGSSLKSTMALTTSGIAKMELRGTRPGGGIMAIIGHHFIRFCQWQPGMDTMEIHGKPRSNLDSWVETHGTPWIQALPPLVL